MEINSFIIYKLHGSLNYEIKFRNNYLILIGENGSCKTTIIKMLFYTLSLQWGKLINYEFESIFIEINKEKFKINKKDINSIFMSNERIKNLPIVLQREINSLFPDLEKIEYLCKRYDIPFEYVFRTLHGDFEISTGMKKKKQSIIQNEIDRLKEIIKDNHILYLPTYRRIEQELQVVLEGRGIENEIRSRHLSRDRNDSLYTELVEFGMRDVVDARDRVLNSLKDFFRDSLNSLTLGYLGEVVDKKYKKVDISPIIHINNNTINSILSRVDDKILSEESKSHLLETLHKIKEGNEPDEHDEVVCHYFIKLLESHQQLEEKEIQIRQFKEVCGRYLQNKNIDYDSSKFTLKFISNIDGSEVEPHQLSSGEKQIVSLFSYLYLSEKRKYFVLIDEPELSLSVKWQRKFLVDIVNGGFCTGLVAVTHSPFIFENQLDCYAHSLGEFIK